MKTVAVEKTDLNRCVAASQAHRIVLTRGGAPVALVVGVEGLDREQVELGISDRFWKLVRRRRQEKTVSRAQLERGVKRKATRRKPG